MPASRSESTFDFARQPPERLRAVVCVAQSFRSCAAAAPAPAAAPPGACHVHGSRLAFTNVVLEQARPGRGGGGGA